MQRPRPQELTEPVQPAREPLDRPAAKTPLLKIGDPCNPDGPRFVERDPARCNPPAT